MEAWIYSEPFLDVIGAVEADIIPFNNTSSVVWGPKLSLWEQVENVIHHIQEFQKEYCVVRANGDMVTDNALHTDSRLDGYIAPSFIREFHYVSYSLVYHTFVALEVFYEESIIRLVYLFLQKRRKNVYLFVFSNCFILIQDGVDPRNTSHKAETP